MGVITVRTPDGHSDFMPERLNIRLSNGNQSSEQAWDDRFTDNLGTTAWPGLPAIMRENFADMIGKGHTLWVNYANVNPNFKTASQFVQDLEATGATVIIERAGIAPGPGPSPIQGYGTCQEWKDAVFGIFQRKVGLNVGPDNEGQGENQAPNLRATIDEIQRLYNGPNKWYVQWQYESVGTPPELRPRLFLPHSGNDPYQRYADVGDWMTALKWEHCSG